MPTAGEMRLIGCVSDASELLDLPEYDLMDAEGAEVSADCSTLTFHCIHREEHNCDYKVMAVQEGQYFMAYLDGEHSHGEEVGMQVGEAGGENKVPYGGYHLRLMAGWN